MFKSKAYRYFSRTLLALIILYFIFDITGGTVLERIVEKKLTVYINNTPDRLYDISFRDLNISVAHRSIRLGKVKFIPRANAMDSLRNKKISMLISFKADSFYFDGLSFFKLLVLYKIELTNLVANSPIIKMYINPYSKKHPKESGLADNTASNKLKQAFIHKFIISNSNFTIIKLTSKDSIFLKLDNSSLSVDEILIEPAKKNPLDRVKYKSMQFLSGALYGGFVNKYNLEADSIMMNSINKTLVIKNFSFLPQNFDISNENVHFAHDVFLMRTNRILFRGISMHGNEMINGFHTDNIILDNLSMTVSTDKRLPKNMNRKPMVGEIIKKVSNPFNIDTLEVLNGRITYNEIVNSETTPLNVFFAHTNITVTHITNEPNLLKRNPELQIKADTKFLDAGDLTLAISVPMSSKEDKMIVSGHLGAMPIEAVNKMVEDPLQARLSSGKINNIDIQFTANTKHSTGKLEFDYNNLKIQLFKDRETNHKGMKEHERKFMNAVANGVIKKDNNKHDKKFTTGIIDYERATDIGIPGYLFRSIKSGLISTFKPGTRRKAVKEEKHEENDILKSHKNKTKNTNKDDKSSKRKDRKTAKPN